MLIAGTGNFSRTRQAIRFKFSSRNRAQEAISIYEQFAKDNGKLAEGANKFFADAKNFSEEIKRSVTSDQSAPVSANVMELDKQRTGKTGVAFGLLRCWKGGKDVKIINRHCD